MVLKRKDGYRIKVDAFSRFIPLIMKERNDALVYLNQEISLTSLDEYVKRIYEETGIRVSYMHIIYSAIVRTYKDMPHINRFIMSGKHYMRNNIEISMAVKKSLSVDAEETSLKFKFEGNESPLEIKQMLDEQIDLEKNDTANEKNLTNLFVRALENIPTFLLKFIVGTLKTMDKVNMLPKSIIDASPFHASAFITNLGSIGLDAALHHIYNLGTVGAFLSIGKKGKKLVMKDGEVVEEKIMNIGFVIDERICDGYYYAKAMRQFYKYLQNPNALDKDS
ncbi:2-oxo acid dehydrogenase subunit E2 [uncultured Helcococcus sp.]|uniref:2-oxo acid dehydrogenase subunit E2 n=1 Tax=uncultured Helcococcus sp. TaxID=1072508 RepID=UPI00288B31F3|nr:2-oxo acid dehydrogenase subunit E2 [uncultured Helcococcus sp.]